MTEILLMIAFFILSSLLSAAETAIIALPRLKVSHMLEERVPGAKILHKLKEHPAEFLTTILIGNNVVNIAASALATSMIIRMFAARGHNEIGIAVGLSTGIMTFIILVFGEIIPKTIAMRNASRVALVLAPIVIFLQLILRPVAFLIGFISRPFIHLFVGKVPEKTPFVTEDEIAFILSAGEKEGVIEQEEREMISSIFEFGDTVVREVMTPRPDIIAASVQQSLPEIIQVIAQTGHSRIPLYDGNNLDNIIGVIYAKDILKNKEADPKSYLRPAIFVPETKKIADLLHEMQSARTHFAVIVDEYGMTSGVVTLEDLIEEIVGEIHDEFEREEKMVEKINANISLVDGKISISDLNDHLQLAIPEGEYDTFAGFMLGQLGKAPSVGDMVKYNNLLISVERIHRRRITRLKINKLPTTGEEAVGG